MDRLTNKKTGKLATWEGRNGGVSSDGTVPIDKAAKQWGPGIVGVLKNIGIIVATEGGAQAAGFWWFITKGDTAIDAARTVGKNAGAASSSVKEILDALPGKAGKTGPIKTVSDAKALDALFNSLGNGGKTLNPGRYPGVVKELPDGTIIRMRPRSQSGGAAIDITVPDGGTIKVHIK